MFHTQMENPRASRSIVKRLGLQTSMKAFGWYESMLHIALRLGQGVWIDVGCGHGHVTEFLRGNGITAIGLDIDSSRLRSTSDRGFFVEADAEFLPMRDSSVNGIIAFELLEHLPNPSGAITEFRRTLTKGGHLLLTTPTPSSPTAGYPSHRSIKSRKDWISLLKRRGFKVKVVNYRYRLDEKLQLPEVAASFLEYVLMLYKRYLSVTSAKLYCSKL